MLTYLDSLCDAMTARDLPRLRHLIEGHPLVRLLPPDALQEARRFLAQKAGRHAVPLATLRFRDQTARLLNERPIGNIESAPAPSAAPLAAPPLRRPHRSALQTELPLSA
ncbi:MAG: hypothetical protein H3C62_00110 [Gemmatimonadaceae bacterium]|nr:hypothetical protein [Gemmatimonadaceae bacterium]